MSHTAATTAHPEPSPPRTTRRRRWHWFAGVPVVVLLAAAAWTFLGPNPADGPAVTGVTEVDVLDDAFEVPAIEIDEGTTVTWTYLGDSEHNVVGEGWGDPEPNVTGTVVHTFDTPGSHYYTCTLHRNMDGRVDVVPASGSS